MSRPTAIDHHTRLPERLLEELPTWIYVRDGVLWCDRCGEYGIYRLMHRGPDARRFGRQHADCRERRRPGLGHLLQRARIEFGANPEQIAYETGLQPSQIIACELDGSGRVDDLTRRLAEWLGVELEEV